MANATFRTSRAQVSQDTHYTIGEAARLLGISVPTLRLYEREGLILPIRKSSRHRRYTADDIERIRCLRETIREKKVSIAGIRRLLALIPCWTLKNCPDDVRGTCPAFLDVEGPCWTAKGKPWECGTTECRLCPVYYDLADCSSIKQAIINITLSSGSSR